MSALMNFGPGLTNQSSNINQQNGEMLDHNVTNSAKNSNPVKLMVFVAYDVSFVLLCSKWKKSDRRLLQKLPAKTVTSCHEGETR